MSNISRRQFLTGCSSLCLLASVAGPALAFWNRGSENSGPPDISGRVFRGDAPEELWKWAREAFFYEKLPGKSVVCNICPNYCALAPGDRSVCRSKVNMNGVLYTLAYGNPCSVHVDPIEKKPLFHFMPRSRAFSMAATGCSFRCLNCQNWEISQKRPEEVRHHDLFPDSAVAEAKRAGADAVAYTYSEPLTYFEYTMDTARRARQEGLKNLLISNGYVNRDPLLALCEVIDAANINLKSFSDKTYRQLNGGRLQPVLDTFKTLHARRIHFEMTTLVVPGYVDDPEMIGAMCKWIVDNLGPDHPLHFLRFFPRYKLDRLPPTPVSALTQFRRIAMDAGIRYVYVGNVPGHDGCHTYCHSCKKMIIERHGYAMPLYALDQDRCRFCGTNIPGVWTQNEQPAAHQASGMKDSE